MFIIFKISLIIAIILTTGVYITGYVDQRQLKEFGYIGARFLILSYVFIYSLINLYILLNPLVRILLIHLIKVYY